MTTRESLTEAERTRRKANIWTWISRAVLVVLILLAFVMVAYLMFSNIALRGQLNNAYDARDRAYVQRDEAIGNWKALFEQVEAIPGEEPVVEAPTPSASNDTTPGPQGVPGRPPTANEILGAVGEYCETSGACQGVPGAPSVVPGPAGQAGADGAPGTQGAPGEPGAPGVTGAAGQTGPAGPSCPEGFTLTITTITVSGADSPAAICLPVPTEPTP